LKTPIPSGVPEKLAQLEVVIAALVELANPEQFRKARAAILSRESLANLSKLVAGGTLALADRVGPASYAASFREVRGDEVITPCVVVEVTDAVRPTFDGRAIGDVVAEADGAVGILEQVWDRVSTGARTHRHGGKKRRGGRR
jgi:hypothetical protein